MRSLVAVALVGLGGLPAGCFPMVHVQRSALVPSVAPPVMTGTSIDTGIARVSFGNATYLRTARPRENAKGETNTGLYIPRSNFAGQALVRLAEMVSVGAKAELALGAGAEGVSVGVAPKPAGNVFGLGPVAEFDLPLAGGFSLFVHAETLLFWAPYAEFGGPGLKDTGSDTVFVFSAALALSYRIGPFAFFAGVAARNQPVNIEHEEVRWDESDNEVRTGPVYGVAFGGITLRMAQRYEATLQIHQPFSDDPVDYRGPAIALWLSVILGDPPRDRPPRAPGRS